MKNIIFILGIFLSLNLTAQTSIEKPQKFVRVYDMQGKKIGKGKISAISENSLELYRHKKTTEFPLSNIGSIRTKHSAGNNILIGAAAGATAFGFLGMATADDNFFGQTELEVAAAGGILGGILGTGVGAISIIFKNGKSYGITADPEKWKVFREEFQK